MKESEGDSTRDLSGHHILVAVAGGIAAYKTVELVRSLLRRGADVRVMMTQSATRFIHPTTFSTITGHPVGLELFREDGLPNTDHLSLPHSSDLVIVAPATANLMAKMAHGIADDLVTTAMLAATCPTLIAPAMNSTMWNHPATQENLRLLISRGIHAVGPEKGEMAAPDELPGVGRMSEPETILHAAIDLIRPDRSLHGKHVVITAGRTEEAIDDVRILTNRSSGRMGVALAEEASRRGARVTLIHGPMDIDIPVTVENVAIRSGDELYEWCRKIVPDADIVIYAAAVADWKPVRKHDGKLEKGEVGSTIHLTQNVDVAAATAALVKGFAVGFALEENIDLEKAASKGQKKGLKYIIINTLISMDSANTQIVVLNVQSGESYPSGLMSKPAAAAWIYDHIQF